MDVTTRYASALENLAENAVQTRLCPDTHTMQFGRKGVPDWLAAHLEDCRGSYTEALRHAAGLCIRCGDDAGKHPAKNPKIPPLFCGSCFERGAWEHWGMGLPLRGGPKGNAKSARKADDALFDGIGDGDEPAFTPDDDALMEDGVSAGTVGASGYLTLWTADGL